MGTTKFVSEPLDTMAAQKFFDHFFEIDLAKMVRASVVMCESPNQGKFVIELSYPWDEHCDYLVRATFKDGMMQHWGWNKKFTVIVEPADYPA